MKFEKGHAKQGGRKPGSPNKTTADIKSRISALIEEQFDSVSADLEKLEPKERVAAYLKFLEYILPKQREQKIDLSALSDQEIDELLERAINKLE
ncbi:hypothetical protein GCM10028805_25930 [Spirosoma harenae]